MVLSHAATTSVRRLRTAAQSTRARPSPTRSHTSSAQARVSSSAFAFSSARRRWLASLTSRRVRKPNRMASSTVGSEAAPAAAVVGGGRRESSRDQRSAVSSGRGSVLGPEAWRRTDSVLMKRGRRGGEVWGVRVPLWIFFRGGGVKRRGIGGGKKEEAVIGRLTRLEGGSASGR